MLEKHDFLAENIFGHMASSGVDAGVTVGLLRLDMISQDNEALWKSLKARSCLFSAVVLINQLLLVFDLPPHCPDSDLSLSLTSGGLVPFVNCGAAVVVVLLVISWRLKFWSVRPALHVLGMWPHNSVTSERLSLAPVITGDGCLLLRPPKGHLQLSMCEYADLKSLFKAP